MATWTTIPDGDLDLDQPWTSLKALAVRDNPIAIAEGAANAPRNDWDSLAGSVDVTTGGGSEVTSWEQKREYAASSTSYDSTEEYSEAHSVGVRCMFTGTATFSFDHRQAGVNTTFSRILLNGVQQQEWSTSSATNTTRTLDLAVTRGDVVLFQLYGTATPGDAFWSSLKIEADDFVFINSSRGA